MTGYTRSGGISARMPLLGLATLALSFSGTWVERSSAQCTVAERAELFDPNAEPGEQFGLGLAMSEDYLVVGAKFGRGNGSFGGEAHVYTRDGQGQWVHESMLTPENQEPGDQFGVTIGIDGDRIAIGAWLLHTAEGDGGGVHVYRREGGGWTLEAILQPMNESTPDVTDIVMKDGLLVYGNRFDSEQGRWAGAAFVYGYDETEGWQLQTKLMASDPDEIDHFGSAVGISDGTIFVGAGWAGPNDAGAVYLFNRDENGTWIESGRIVAHDARSGHTFGVSLDVDGDWLVVGDKKHDELARDAGAAYVFWRGANGRWYQEAKLFASDGRADDWFGYEVAIADDRVLVGTYSHDHLGPDSGAAYLFRREGPHEWVFQTEIVPSGGTAGDAFSRCIDMTRSAAIISQTGDDTFGTDAGCAGYFEFDCPQLEDRAVLGIAPTPLLAGQPAEFTFTGGQPNQAAWLVYSTSGIGATYVPGLNVVLGMENPILASGPRSTNELGNVVWRATMPVINESHRVWFQGVQRNVVTNLVRTGIVD